MLQSMSQPLAVWGQEETSPLGNLFHNCPMKNLPILLGLTLSRPGSNLLYKWQFSSSKALYKHDLFS